MWNTVLFDLDGTITDSGEGITRCVQHALREGFGIETEDLHELDVFVGPPLKEQFMSYASLSEEEAERAIGLYRERYAALGMYENRVYEGVRELLEDLRDGGFQAALASSKPTEFCRQILEYFGLAQYFSVVVGSEMDGARSQKAEVVEEVLRLCHMTKRRNEVVLVGDRSYDIAGAREAQIGSIGVTFGYGSREELEAEWPDVICDTPLEVRNVLIGQSERAPWRTGPALPPYMAYGKKAGKIEDLRVRGCALPGDGSVWQRIWRCIYPFLIDVVLSTVISAVCGIVIGIVLSFMGRYDGPDVLMKSAVLITGIMDAALLPLFWFLFKRDEAGRNACGAAAWRIPEKIGMNAGNAAFVAAASVLIAGVLELLITFIAISDPEYEIVAEAISVPPVLLQIVCVGVIGPLMEEVLFRGLIYRRLRDYVGVFWAILLSAAVFGLAHGNIIQGIFAGLFGVVLAMLYEHYGSLWAPVAAHVANNVFSVFSTKYLWRLPGGIWVLYYMAGIVFLIGLVVHMFKLKGTVNVV